MMPSFTDRILGGVLGLLVGDAVGVPYEFRRPEELPPYDQIDMLPPKSFMRSYSHVPLGTWSDDGAQALCLLESLLECDGLDENDFAKRMLNWFETGHLAVDDFVFDVGIQTSQALRRIKQGVDASKSGLTGERNNGNGSLMRCLPILLCMDGGPAQLVEAAHRQSKVTHGHPRTMVCCALYALWAREELLGNQKDGWDKAVAFLRSHYPEGSAFLFELETQIAVNPLPHGKGLGYVVDCLHSAKTATDASDFETIVRDAVAFGNDTDTTAAVAAGIAGIRHGIQGIPAKWIEQLRGKEITEPLLERLRSWSDKSSAA